MNRSDKLGKTPILKLMITMSAPAMFSMLVQALYNIVDSFFVGMISNTDNEITALNYAFPLQMIFFAVALGIGVGTSSLISRKLGEGKNEEASRTAQTGILLCACAIVITFACSFFVPRLFMKIYSDASTDVVELSVQYLSIAMGFSIGMFIENVFNKFLQSTGNMNIPMFAQLIGAITNIILDPIFIFQTGTSYTAFDTITFKMPFGLGMGITGAAIATVIGQIAAGLFVLCFALFKKQAINFNFNGFKLNMAILKEIFSVGIAVTIVNSINSISTMILNLVFKYAPVEINGETKIIGPTILGTYFKIQSFIFLPIFGMNQGVMPILSYNYGAKNAKRFNKTFVYSLIFALTIMTFGFVLFQTVPSKLLFMISEEATKAYGVTALRIISLCFFGAAGNIIVSSLYQAVGHGVKSAALNLLRQAFILIPLAFGISYFLKDINLVWIAFPVAEYLSLIIFSSVTIYTLIKLNKIMNTKEVQTNN